MITELIFKSPYDERTITAVKPFMLDMPVRCYFCGTELRPEEKKHKSIFKYYNPDGSEMGKIETYVCFACIEKFTGENIREEEARE